MADDAAVIAGFLDGHGDSHRLVDRWIQEVLSHWRFSLGTESEDVAQDVRRKLLLSFRAERFQGEASLRTYVWKAAHRAAIDRARARRRKPESTSLNETPEPVSSVPGPDNALEAQERRALLTRVLEALHDECRRLLALIVYEELPYAAIAERLGTNEANVKMKALRCRRRATEIYRELVTSGPRTRP